MSYTFVATFLVLYYWQYGAVRVGRSESLEQCAQARLRFDDAMLVIGDRFALIEQDRMVGEEPRWQALGWAGGNFLLLVAHSAWTEGEDEMIRIISAPKASRKERKRYDENRAKEFSR